MNIFLLLILWLSKISNVSLFKWLLGVRYIVIYSSRFFGHRIIKKLIFCNFFVSFCLHIVLQCLVSSSTSYIFEIIFLELSQEFSFHDNMDWFQIDSKCVFCTYYIVLQHKQFCCQFKERNFFVKIILLSSSGHKSLMNRQTANPKWFKITNDQLATEKLVYIFYLKLNQSNALTAGQCLKNIIFFVKTVF